MSDVSVARVAEAGMHFDGWAHGHAQGLLRRCKPGAPRMKVVGCGLHAINALPVGKFWGGCGRPALEGQLSVNWHAPKDKS